MKEITGFSKFNKQQKIDWLTQTFFENSPQAQQVIKQYWNNDEKLQKLHDEFTENTISNFYLPFGIAPNFLINGKFYTLPMTIEESSVIAAASNAAKFWSKHGGFSAKVKNTTKIGHVHFFFKGEKDNLTSYFKEVKPKILQILAPITKNMEKRGGGLHSLELVDKTLSLAHYYQLEAKFETLDAMGANFINTCLEEIAAAFYQEAKTKFSFTDKQPLLEINMSILSNYVTECIAYAEVNCPAEELLDNKEESLQFAQDFVNAVKIAEIEPYRAVTHNKGIMNGIDAVVLATGNDFRAVEAGVHAYASRKGSYSSLTQAKIENNRFIFSIEIPLALGTVGGLTSLHPLVKLALEMLGKPTAKELMQIVAVAGLAQNFAAIKSLTTTGIQEGHMKMHLMNILNQFEATEEEKSKIVNLFHEKPVSHSSVVEELQKIRDDQKVL